MKQRTIPFVKRLSVLVDHIERMELTPYQFDELIQISKALNQLYAIDINENNKWLTYKEMAEILDISYYCTTIYLSHYTFSRYRMETIKGKENKVLFCPEFVNKLREYLYKKRRYNAIKNLNTYYNENH